jgi:hypothetical protein
MAEHDTASRKGRAPSFRVEDTYWGYIIHSDKGRAVGYAVAQSVSFLLGVAFLTFALGIVALSPLVFGAALSPVRIGAAVLFGAAAAYLLWFASRGTQTEVHIDTSTRELREVICNRAGRPTTVGTHDFGTITGVFLDGPDHGEIAMLVVQDRDSDYSICLAQAPQGQLLALRDRVARDLLGHAPTRAGVV